MSIKRGHPDAKEGAGPEPTTLTTWAGPLGPTGKDTAGLLSRSPATDGWEGAGTFPQSYSRSQEVTGQGLSLAEAEWRWQQ